jgi:hypothetical protein
MATEKDLTAAKIMYNRVKEALDNMGWTYDENESKLNITTGAGGKDLNIDIDIYVEAEKHIVTVLSMLPIDVPEDLRIDLSLAVSLINNRLVDGSFDYDRFARQINESGYKGSLMLEVMKNHSKGFYDVMSNETYMQRAADAIKKIRDMVDGEQ